MKINNTLDIARWEKVKCCCNHDSVEKEYPIAPCMHCKCEEAYLSVPQKNFKIKEYDPNTKKTIQRTITEITLVRGHDYQDVIGWNF